jgi:hypothetical protein
MKNLWAGIISIILGIIVIVEKKITRGMTVYGDCAVACGGLLVLAGLVVILIYIKNRKKQ